MVDVSMCGVGAASKVGYMNGSGGATPLCHVGTFFEGLLRLLSLSTGFSSYSTMHATDGAARTARGPLS